MCKKCEALDGKIAHYRKMAEAITDELALDGIKRLIVEMNAQKAALHPEK